MYSQEYLNGALLASSFSDALCLAAKASCEKGGRTFIVGGSGPYESALKHPDCEFVFLTQLIQHPLLPCDAFFPKEALLANFSNPVNITKAVHDVLAPKLGALFSGTLVATDDGMVVQEKDITYKFTLWRK